MASFDLEILTPLRRLWAGKAESVLFETDDGEIEILAGHAPTALPVRSAPVRILAGGSRRIAALTEGMVLVRPDKVEFYVDTAEWPEEIDGERATKALERAEARIALETFAWEWARTKAAIARARSRMEAVELAKAVKA